jgi:RNA polymerase sigma factor (TIGR02999 family)
VEDNGLAIERASVELRMNDVTRILNAIEQGDPRAADQLLPLVYDALRQLAAQKLAHERPGLTLQPTALVHEAYLRLVAGGDASGPRDRSWNSRRHFFAAAAEAMRRILVERARRKKRRKHGNDLRPVELAEQDEPVESSPEEQVALEEEILALNAALPRLAELDPAAAQVVQLHFFAGLSIEQAAEALGVSRATAYRQWTYARAWLRCALEEGLGTA